MIQSQVQSLRMSVKAFNGTFYPLIFSFNTFYTGLLTFMSFIGGSSIIRKSFIPTIANTNLPHLGHSISTLVPGSPLKRRLPHSGHITYFIENLLSSLITRWLNLINFIMRLGKFLHKSLLHRQSLLMASGHINKYFINSSLWETYMMLITRH